MKDIKVDILTVDEFGKKIKEESQKLVNILDNMKNDTLKYDDMIDSKTGNLYKETMHKVLDEEKKRLEEKGTYVGNKFITAANEYTKAIENIKEGVRKRK